MGKCYPRTLFRKVAICPPGHMSTSEEPENDAFRTWVTVVWGPPDALTDSQLDTYDYVIGGVKRSVSPMGDTAGL